ncbi:YdaS family helix-turn-helix protein [Pseudoalteromonas sp. S16_S37]|uniref:YdaS family helix-turn-helix protein n=1 Tax=Pseudoalteromonas sp. S16_S37 TaxID=2720228 RepID=UPI0016801107|nr:YdaS family helix-turn-helix protein [Pseudoalteromonas sp. S16_S37]MBD1583469.1 helix-turn-helix domain-containing protein [Pseudoalteromonas sp. S16_S37]
MNIVSKSIKKAGGVTKVSKSFGISYQAVQQWVEKGVPAGRVLKLESQSGVSRTLLRPDLYPPEIKTLATGEAKGS